MYPGGQVKASEVFVSDGSKCDIGRLQMMFGKGISVAVQVRLVHTAVEHNL
jgi:LL-diaminopimelate aminotransferase